MALSLGIKLNSRFRIGDKIMTVLDIGPGPRALVEVDGKKMNITEVHSTEVVKDVFVSYVTQRGQSRFCSHRLVFEAPREIAITRL
jgi:hypothetical protein